MFVSPPCLSFIGPKTTIDCYVDGRRVGRVSDVQMTLPVDIIGGRCRAFAGQMQEARYVF